MKKFCKFILGTLSIAALAGGAYLLIKKLTHKESDDILEDDLDYFSKEEDETGSEAASDGREYVSINITTESSDSKEEDEQDTATKTEAADTPSEETDSAASVEK